MRNHRSFKAALAAVLAMLMVLAVVPAAAFTPVKADANSPEDVRMVESATEPALTVSVMEPALQSNEFSNNEPDGEANEETASDNSGAVLTETGTELAAPKPITVVLDPAKHPVINWGAVANAEGYEVWRKAANGVYELIAAVNGTSFVDESELIGLARYYYKVRAVAEGSEGLFSKEVTITAYGIKAPAGVKASLTDRKPTIIWNAVANATSYNVFRSTVKNGEYELVATVSERSFVDMSDLEPLTKYFYKLTASDDLGFVSAFSAVVYVSAYGIKAPAGVKAQLVDTKPTLTWNAAENATAYEIYRSTVKDAEYELIATSENLTYTDNDELVAFKRYYYKVRGIDDFGNAGLFSSIVNVTAYGIKAPTKVKVQLVETKPTLTWGAGLNATAYEIYRSTAKDGEYELIGTTAQLTYTDNDSITALQRYYYKVRGIDNYNNASPFCTAVYIIAYGVKAPSALKVQLVETKPTLTWGAGENAAYYEIYRSASATEGFELIGTSETLSYTDNDELTALARYYYKVKGKDNYGNESSFSTVVNIVAYGIKAPTGIKVRIVDTKPYLTWNAAANATAYVVFRSEAKDGEYDLIDITEELSFSDFSELVPFKRYYYKVMGIDNYGNSSLFSAVVNIAAFGLKAPTGMSARIVDDKPFISWSAAVGATAYDVYRCTSSNGEFELAGRTSELSFSDNGNLIVNHRYYYKVKAVDDYGNESPFSASVYIATPNNIDPYLAAPYGLSIMMADSTPVVIWRAVCNAVSYQVWRSSGGNYELAYVVSENGCIDNDLLTPGATYSYMVRAVNAEGKFSLFSEIVSVDMPTESGLPEEPFNPYDPELPNDPGNTFDAPTFIVEADADSFMPGEVFTVAVSIVGEYGEAHVLNHRLNFDPNVFEFVALERGIVLRQIIDNGGIHCTDGTSINGSLRCVAMMPFGGFDAQGVLYYATFRVKNNAVGGVTNFEQEVVEFANFPLNGANTPIIRDTVNLQVEILDPKDARARV